MTAARPLEERSKKAWQDFLAKAPASKTIDLILVDLAGIARGKRLPVEGFDPTSLGEQGFSASVYALDVTGRCVDQSGLVWEHGDPNLPIAVDPDTFAVLPWQDHGVQVIGGLLGEDGSPFFADPRTILAQAETALTAKDLHPVIALEFEFYLLDQRSARDGTPRIKRERYERPDESIDVYSLDALDRQAAFLTCLDDYAAAQGLPLKGAISEYAPGQFEANLGHVRSAVQAADQGLMLKRAVKAAARSIDASATFMAKPFAEQAGNGLHVHLSLVDEAGDNLFAADETLLHQAIAGLQATMAEAMLFFAPNANSYRRFRPHSYAPLAPTWGHNNRTVALRIPASPPAARRIEHRLAGADANPYLALAAVLAGIDHGLNHRLTPTAPIIGNGYEQSEPSLPGSWEAAIEHLAVSSVMPAFLGDAFCRLYRICKAVERDRYRDVIPLIDYKWYQHSV